MLIENIKIGINEKMVTFLLLFDFRKAFDTTSPSSLFRKLRDIGFSNTALLWIKTYMIGRSQRVVSRSGESEYLETNLGVPQGSVLGPLLFSININDLQNHLNLEGIKFILYADDLQVYLTVPLDQILEAIARLSLAAQKQRWAAGAALQLNATKTKAIFFGSEYRVRAL